MRLWRVRFQYPPYGAGYYKFVRAWTRRGALRAAQHQRHPGWTMSVSRWRP